MEMFLAPLRMVYTFPNLFVLRERVLNNRKQFLTSKLLKQGYRLLIFASLLIDTINIVKVFKILSRRSELIVNLKNFWQQSKKGGKDQESIQSNTTPHGKVTEIQLNITNKSEEVSPFPAGDQKAAMNRSESMRITQMIHKSTPLERSVKIF